MKPRYSGPGKSGRCKCGHFWQDHHLGMVMNLEFYNATQEAYVPQECEFHGSNEDGGYDSNGEEHCFSYEDCGT